jgi:micrococcal nuclease
MAKIERFGQRDRKFVAKSIRDWDEDHARTKRTQRSDRPYRLRHGGFSAMHRLYGIAALIVFMALAAAWPQVAPALTSLPGASSLIGPATGGTHSDGIQKTAARKFPICGTGKRSNCVVDGDTFWVDGKKIRIADINAPEVSSPKCGAEKARGDKATRRLQSLLNEGRFEMRGSGNDKYGRSLRTLHRDGRSLGGALVDEGLAHEWNGHKESWCG